VEWTNAQAVPTVTLAKLTRGDADRNSYFPADIQPYGRATVLFARKRLPKELNTDIGAHVKVNDCARLDRGRRTSTSSWPRAGPPWRAPRPTTDIASLTAGRYSTLVEKQAISQQSAGSVSRRRAGEEGDHGCRRGVCAAAGGHGISFKQIVAPFDGVVTETQTPMSARLNQFRQFGPGRCSCSDLHRVRIYVQVPQAFTAGLRPGLKATFEMPPYPGQKFDATLGDPLERDDSRQRAACRSSCQAEQLGTAKLYGGAYCRVDFQVPGDPNMVRLPATAR